MKLPVLLAVITSLLTGSIAASPTTGAPAPASVFKKLEAGTPQSVVLYGTSLTHGGAWAKATQQWFKQHYPEKVKVFNAAGPGQNSDWGLANLKRNVLTHQPDLVFIEFSYNDAHEKFKMPVERGASNLKAIVEALRAENPGVVIVLQTMNVGWDAPNGKRSFSIRPDLEAYNNNYREFARTNGLPLLDHYATWKKLQDTDPKTYEAYIPDGTHPSDKGSLAVTWPTVKAWLEAARAAAKSPAANKTR